MQIIPWKNLLIYSVGAGEAVIWTHGGYTPRRGIYPGSGKTTVPPGLTLLFYTAEGDVSNGENGRRFICGQSTPAVVETARARQLVRNYSIAVELTDNRQPSGKPIRDYIVTRPGTKAHLRDVWDAMGSHTLLNWKTIHYFACRVDKLTYTGEVAAPAVDPALYAKYHGGAHRA